MPTPIAAPMETRLSLRQRLLRIDDSVIQAAASTASGASAASSDSASGRSNQSSSSLDRPEQPQDEQEDDDDGDEEGDDEEVDEDDDNDDAEANGGPAQPPKPSEKCPTASVVKLLFSHSDPQGRNPTVCFDYPPSLGLSRSYSDMLVATVDAQELALFYRTSWERNCVKNAFAAAGLSRTRKKWSGWHLAWAKHVQRAQFQRFRGDHMQVFNHFPDPWVIGRKDRLMKTLANCRRRFGASYDFFPEGFALPEQLDAFQRALERNEAFVAGLGVDSKEKVEAATGPLWIVKPPASACGRGIRVLSHRAACRMCEDVKKDAKKLRQGKKPKPRIVQKYVANPLLLGDGGRFKFDLRLYVAVTSMDPLRIYLFQEGITRFCTAPYSLQNPSNRFAHLTNYAINKASAGFVENADAYSADAGSKWSLEALLRSLKTQGLLEDPETLMAEIRAIVCKTVIAAESHLTPLTHQFTGKKTACFELFGFDLMLDAKLRPWLIEVNVSPSLMGGSPLDRRVKGLLLSDICHLVGLQVPLASIPRDRLPVELQSRASASAVSSASSSSSASTSTSRPLRRSKTMRTTPQNRQLHELVLDSTVECFNVTHLSLFAASDWDIVRAMDDEMDRRGHFDRIFPASTATETAVYSRFFTCQRYANALCAKWLQTPRVVRLRLRRQQSVDGRPAPSGVVQARRSLLMPSAR